MQQDLGRERLLRNRIEQMRRREEAALFQTFVLSLLPELGYSDTRLSHLKSDLGQDAVAIAPDGTRCFVCVSFDASLAKVRTDATRWKEGVGDESVRTMVFVTWQARTNKTIEQWRRALLADFDLDLRVLHSETLTLAATSRSLWGDVCDRLSISSYPMSFSLVGPWDVDQIDYLLQIRETKFVELPEWSTSTHGVSNCLVLGKPGSGKTTTLYRLLKASEPNRVLIVTPALLRDIAQVEALLDASSPAATIVFDDVQDNPESFRLLIGAYCVRRRRGSENIDGVRLLAACRSQDWTTIQGVLPERDLMELEFHNSQLRLGPLDESTCAELIDFYSRKWGLQMAPDVERRAAKVAERGDGTPLFVLSILLEAKTAEDRRLTHDHLTKVPDAVADLWSRYWSRLPAESQAILRVLKLLRLMAIEPTNRILQCGGQAFGLAPYLIDHHLPELTEGYWIQWKEGVARLLDSQVDAIPLEQVHYSSWDAWVDEQPVEQDMARTLRLGMSSLYMTHLIEQANDAEQSQRYLERTLKHLEDVSEAMQDEQSELFRGAVLINRAAVQSGLAAMEVHPDRRLELIREALAGTREAVILYERLGFNRGVVTALGNTSSYIADLARLESDGEKALEMGKQAYDVAESAVSQAREAEFFDVLSLSLITLSARLSDLVVFQESPENRIELRRRAQVAAEEAVQLCRDFGSDVQLAAALDDLAHRRMGLAEEEKSTRGRKVLLDEALESAQEATSAARRAAASASIAKSSFTTASVLRKLSELAPDVQSRRTALECAAVLVEEAIEIYRDLRNRSLLALSLNSASNLLEDLALMQSEGDAKLAGIERSTQLQEEAVDLYRSLGQEPDLGLALANLAARYYSRWSQAATADGEGWASKAVLASEECVRIRRGLGQKAGLAVALSNSSVMYLAIARGGRPELAGKATGACSEAAQILEALDMKVEWAACLINASSCHNEVAKLSRGKEQAGRELRMAANCARQGALIFQDAGRSHQVIVALGACSDYLRLMLPETRDKEERVELLIEELYTVQEWVSACRGGGDLRGMVKGLRQHVLCLLDLVEDGVQVPGDALLEVCSEGAALAQELGLAEEERSFTELPGMLGWEAR